MVPLVYRAAIAARGFVDERRADRLGVPLSQIGQFSGHGGCAVGADRRRRALAAHWLPRRSRRTPRPSSSSRPSPSGLRDLSAAVTAAENMPASRRRAAHAAIAQQLDGIDADLMARLGVV